jgi:signal transduction histidine kinase
VNRMTELIEDLLTYSRATGNMEAYEKIDMNEIVDEIRIVYKEEIEQKSFELNSDHLPVIYGIPFQIRQLMLNLVNNAIKYKRTDRMLKININTGILKGSDIMEKDAEVDKAYQRISVSDNGIGFNPSYAEKIFNIFQRLNNNSTHRGSGIGLAICKKIIQNHHGFISATGKENDGARFDFYIPVEV